MKIYTYDENGKFTGAQEILPDKEESAKKHMSVYHFPDILYTRKKPMKDHEGLEQYFVDGKWEYREIIPEPEEPVVEELVE